MGDIKEVQAELKAEKKETTRLKAELKAETAKLKDSEKNLATANTALETANADLATANTALETANKSLEGLPAIEKKVKSLTEDNASLKETLKDDPTAALVVKGSFTSSKQTKEQEESGKLTRVTFKKGYVKTRNLTGVVVKSVDALKDVDLMEHLISIKYSGLNYSQVSKPKAKTK